MQLLKIALRNLMRNRRRSIITMLGIAFGISMMILTIGMQEYAYRNVTEEAVGSMAGHVVVQAQGYNDAREVDMVVTQARTVASTLEAAFPEGQVVQRIFMSGLITSTSGAMGVGITGIQPDAEKQVNSLDDKINQGSWLVQGESEGILIGKKLAETLEVEVGDKLVIQGSDLEPRLFRLTGVFGTGSSELDGFVAIIPIQAAQGLLGDEDSVSQISVHLDHPDDSIPAAQEAQTLLGRQDLEVLSWQQALPSIHDWIVMDRQSGYVFLMILGCVALLGVLNTILMSTMERTREFGVMMAVGMRPGRLARLILSEGLVLGLFSVCLGVLMGYAMVYPLQVYGIDMSASLGEAYEMEGVAVSTELRAEPHWPRFAVCALVGLIATVLAAAWPAWKVSRQRPVDALRSH